MHPSKELIKFDHMGIGKLLADDRLIVPLNQRDYSWGDDEIEDLWQDFVDAMDAENGTHFLGTIVLTRGESDYPEVTDGQQRLATTSMLLAALRDYLVKLGKTEAALSINREFLFKYDRDAGEDVPRLTLNVDDRSFFEETVLTLPADKKPDAKKKDKPQLRESKRKIESAANKIRGYVNHQLENEKDERKIRLINNWIKFLQYRALVITIQTPEDHDAYVMFETLNDRGLETSQADLLKNYLLRKAGKEHLREAQQKWSSMAAKLESLGRKKITVSFIRHLLITMYGPTKERAVLKTIKKEIDRPSQSIKFLETMDQSADDYVAMLNPTHPKWKEYGDATREHLRAIHLDLDVKQIWPLLFAVTKHYSVKETKLALKYLVNLSVRFLVVGGRGGLLDRHYALKAQEIGTGKIKTAKELAKSLEEIAPTDESFELEFSTHRVSDGNLARYYLRAMENAASQLPSPEVMPLEDRDRLNLEHILPENPGKNWPEFTDEEAEAHYRRIGNMVLMLASHNALIGNKPFSEKRQHLLASSLSLTKMAGKPNVWRKEQIIARQKELAKLAVETWPLTVR
jgi:hypothetical protein